MDVREIPTPALIFDERALRANLVKMADFAEGAGVRLRPHAKTHKCPYIARLQVEAGAVGVTVAKLGEAEVMAQAGIGDILIANQVVTAPKIERLARLQKESRVTVAIEDTGVARLTASIAQSNNVTIPAVIEVDIGMKRAGLAPREAVEKAENWSGFKGLELRGIMGYEGHCVFIEDAEERRKKAEEAVGRLVEVAEGMRRAGLPVDIVSAGGTGTYNVTGCIKGVTEIQPGSYVLMDGRYAKLHPEFGHAVYVLSTVTAVKEDFFLADAGLKSQTVEFGMPLPAELDGVVNVKLNEEHANVGLPGARSRVKVGDVVRFIPSHICTTVNLYDRAYLVENNRAVGIVPIAARGRSD